MVRHQTDEQLLCSKLAGSFGYIGPTISAVYSAKLSELLMRQYTLLFLSTLIPSH